MMAKLPLELLEKGVICSSAGNHAQGVALAAKRLNCNAVIAMPVTTPDIKVLVCLLLVLRPGLNISNKQKVKCILSKFRSNKVDFLLIFNSRGNALFVSNQVVNELVFWSNRSKALEFDS
jgi:hypothetical protein